MIFLAIVKYYIFNLYVCCNKFFFVLIIVGRIYKFSPTRDCFPQADDDIECDGDGEDDSDDNYVVNTLQYPCPASMKPSDPSSYAAPVTSSAAYTGYTSASSTDHSPLLDLGDEALTIEGSCCHDVNSLFPSVR